MKKISELTNFFYNELHPDLKKLEDDRKKLAKNLVYVGMGIAALSFGTTYLIFTNSTSHSEADLAPIFIGFGLFMWIKKFMSKDYAHEFKDNIIHPLIEQIDESLQYSKTLSVAQAHLSVQNSLGSVLTVTMGMIW